MEIYLDNLLNEEIEFLDKELDINKKKDFFDCLEARKMIFNNLYSDDSLIGFELSSYIKKTFTKNGNYLNYFDLVTLDRDNETAHLIIFCNSEDDLNLKNLGWKIQNANDLINNSLSKKDEYTGNQKIARVAEDNVELANILQEIKRFEDIKIDIVLFDFAKKNNSNKIESFIEKESNNCSTDLNLLTNKSYKVKMSDSFLNEGKQNKKMTLSYLDDNKNAQEDYAINGNFIKNGNNYVFSIQAYSLYKAYKEYGEELFDRNVRYFIKSTTGISGQVNKSILNTLENEPQDFWTLNNGIVIIGDVAEDGINQINKTITFNNLDIVNGAQTVTNIYEFAKKKSEKKANELKSVYIIAKVIDIKDSTIEEEKNLVDEIVKAANSQKPIKERDLVSNNPEMKELQDVFVQNKTILEIKRGERRSDIENRIKKVYPDFKGKPKNVKNDALGQDILSLFYLKPFEALQKLGKLFNKDLYDKIFNNTYLIPQDYFYIWDFNQWMNEKINELREDLIVGQELNLEDNKKTSNSALFDQTRRWVISTLWLLLWYNKDVKDKLDVKFPSVVEIEELLDNKNDQTFLMKETEMLHPVNLTSDLKKAIIRFIDLCHKNIVTVYNKAKNKDNKSAGLAVTTFSFRRSEFMSFLKELLFDSDRLTDPLQEIVGSFLED